MTPETIKEIDETLKLHSLYSGTYTKKYLKRMDALAINESGAPGLRLSKLLNKYYKAIGVENIQEAFDRLRSL